jgi:hypothetical protein
MLSPALSELLERARVRFGLDVEVLDAGLNSVYPESATGLSRIIRGSAAVRQTLLDALAGGRAEWLEGDGVHYRLYPLRQSHKRRPAAGLLAIRRGSGDLALPLDAEPWSDLTRAIVETDLAAAETLGVERERSRRLTGALRFIEHITETQTEATLARSLVQAAAVWYDVDARMYRRTISGDFVLDTWLPGVRPDAASVRLSAQFASGVADLQRLASAADVGESSAGHDALLVPLTTTRGTDWLLALIGTVPVEAEVVLRLIARMAGAQFSSFVERRTEDARYRFDSELADTSRAPELVAMRLVRGLARAVEASSGSISLTRKGLARRIAAVGQVVGPGPIAVPAEGILAPDRLVCAIALGGEDFAVLDLHGAPEHEFSTDDAVVAQVGASALRTWLAGTLTSFDATAAILDVTATGVPPFFARIPEELERARRFDLRLSLILIDGHAPSETMAQLQEELRRELRGSDVTGVMSGRQVAALLTHTDALGLDNVVRRVRQRLADAAELLNVADLKLGQAVFSPEVRTADALLELALRQAEPVTLH